MIGFDLLFLLGLISSTSDDKKSNNVEFHYSTPIPSPTNERKLISNENLKTNDLPDQNIENRKISWKSANGNIRCYFEFDKNMNENSFKTWQKHVNRLPLYGNIVKYALLAYLGYKIGKLAYQYDKSLENIGNQFLGPPSLQRATAAVLASEGIYIYALYRIFGRK